MKTIWKSVVMAAGLFAFTGCPGEHLDVNVTSTDPGSDEGTDTATTSSPDADTDTDVDTDWADTDYPTDTMPESQSFEEAISRLDVAPIQNAQFSAIDILLVVDNSSSMAAEQQVLATNIQNMINYLTDPLPGWPALAVEDVRVAVTTTNMGLSWDGNPFSASDGFPPAALGQKCADPDGDNGALYDPSNSANVSVLPELITCSADGNQCSWLTGTECQLSDTSAETGNCTTSGPYDVDCSSIPVSSDGWYSAADLTAPGTLSCLTAMGIEGCGFEQQLQAGATSLEQQLAAGKIRRDALLAVIVISDEEDCSMENGPSLFATDEVQANNSVAINTACGNHPEFLMATADLRNRLVSIKGGDADAVFFGALVGVPKGRACEGTGTEIGSCLNHPKMQLNIIQDPDMIDVPKLIFDYACTREVDGAAVTQASPGIRFVELAQQFGENAYVSSICNEYWTDAIVNISARLAVRVSN